MPKKTRPGGRYTKGIKRTPSGGYGGQVYGRRGCMIFMLGVLALAALPIVGAAAFLVGVVAR